MRGAACAALLLATAVSPAATGAGSSRHTAAATRVERTHVETTRRSLDEDPPAPPPGPLPPYPTVSYVVNVTRLNENKPIISGNIGNSSTFTYNFHATWVPPQAAAPGSGLQRRRRQLDEEPEAEPDGLLLQVETLGGGNGSAAAAHALALVTRSIPQNGSSSSAWQLAAPSDPALGNGGVIAFEPLDPSKLVLQANSVEENFGVGAPSLSYSAEEQRYYLVYQAASLNNRTQRLHKSLHFATSDGDPRDPKTWQRHGPLFDSYPFNTTETEYGAFLQDLGATLPPPPPPLGSHRRSLDEEPPPVQAPHYLVFSASADAPGQAAGLQLALVTGLMSPNATTHFAVLPNKTLLDPRVGKFDAHGLIPGPPAEKLADGTLIYLYNGLQYNANGGGTTPAGAAPWELSVGYAILDGTDPLTVLQRAAKPILEPEEPWELKGRVENSVLLSGLRRVDDAALPAVDLPYWLDQFVGYYAGAESAVGAALIKVHCVSTNPSLQNLLVTANPPPPSAHGHHHRRMEEGDPLDPPFAPNIFEYKMTVGELIPSVTIQATSLSPFAEMKVNNKAVERGAPANITVGTGNTNNVQIHMLAEDGVTPLTYVVHVIRASSSYCELSDLTIDDGELSPKFSSAVTEYTVSYTNNISAIKVTPKTAKTADIKVNGNTTKSGQESPALPLASGAGTTITIAVTSQDGTKTLAYRIVAARAPSPDPTLRAIEIKGLIGGKPDGANNQVLWFPAFNGQPMPVNGNPTPVWVPRPQGLYSVLVNTKNEQIEITLHGSAPGAQIKLNGAGVGDGAASKPMGLAVNAVSTVKIDVMAQDGKSTMEYIIDIVRLGPSTDAELSNLICHGPGDKDICPLSPVFDPDIRDYFTWVDPGAANVWVTPTSRSPEGSKLTVNTKEVASGKDSDHFPLKDIKDEKFDITTESLAEDTKTKIDYLVHLQKLPDPEGVAASAELAALLTDSGHLTPVFSSGTFDYTATVTTGNVKVMPIPLSKTVSLLEVNGKKCDPFKMSQQFPVKNDGTPTNITVEVLSADKSSDQKYNVEVTYKLPSDEAALSALTMEGGPSTFTPAFSPAVRVYAAHFPYAPKIEVDLTPTTTIATAKLAVNGIPVASGKPTAKLPVAGDDVFLITAESEDKKNISMYSVAVHVDSNANLKTLAISTGGLTPAFAPTTFAYKSAPAFNTAELTVTPTEDEEGQVIEVDGKVVKSGAASEAIKIDPAVGKDTKITVTCKSKDGRTTMTYIVDVTNVPPSADAALKELALAPGALDPKFDPKTLKYAVKQPFGTKTMLVTPTANGPVSKLQVNGKDVASGKPSEAEPTPGDIKIILTAQDGKTTETYELTITDDPPSNDCKLKSLVPSEGKLVPDFDPGVTKYVVSGAKKEAGKDFTMTPVANGPGADVKADGKPLKDGKSEPVELKDAHTTITIDVTAQDGKTKETVTVDVDTDPPKSNDAGLKELTISAGALTPVFAAATKDYTAAPPGGTATVTVTATVNDDKAKITVQGAATDSGKASAEIKLEAGKEEDIAIVVTAEDGVTKETFTVKVTDAAPAPAPAPTGDATLKELTISAGTLDPVFAGATKAYKVTEAAGVTSVTVKAAPTADDSTMTCQGAELKADADSAAIDVTAGKDATITIEVTAKDGTTKESYTIDASETGRKI